MTRRIMGTGRSQSHRTNFGAQRELQEKDESRHRRMRNKSSIPVVMIMTTMTMTMMMGFTVNLFFATTATAEMRGSASQHSPPRRHRINVDAKEYGDELNDLGQPIYDFDVSWAIKSNQLSDLFGPKQQLYDDYLRACHKAAGPAAAKYQCEQSESFRIRMNNLQPMSMRNYTEQGFVKIRAPTAMFKLVEDFWTDHRSDAIVEWRTFNTYHNMWESPPTLVNVQNLSIGGGGELQDEIWSSAREVMEEWTGMHLAPCSMWGIRMYHNGSILAPHVDRNPLVTSAIINVDQDVDEEWPLEVWGHDGKPYNITMEPGDMVLYESHTIIHGRPFPLRGKFYANIFIHFEPIGPYRIEESGQAMDYPAESLESIDANLPPYVIPGSVWEEEWHNHYPGGWKLLHSDAQGAAAIGDVEVLINLAIQDPESLHRADENGWRPIHEAARGGHMEAVKLLLDVGADVNDKTAFGRGYSVQRIVRDTHGESHPLYEYLRDEIGAMDVGPEL